MSYLDKIAYWLKEQPDGKVLEVTKADNPEKFLQAVKILIDLNVPEQLGYDLTFSDDFKRLKINHV